MVVILTPIVLMVVGIPGQIWWNLHQQKSADLYLGGGNSNIFYFHPENWGRFPFWLIFFKGVETTN